MTNGLMNATQQSAETRLRRIAQVRKTIMTINSNQWVWSPVLLMQEICLEWGVTKKTAEEYIALAKIKDAFV